MNARKSGKAITLKMSEEEAHKMAQVLLIGVYWNEFPAAMDGYQALLEAGIHYEPTDEDRSYYTQVRGR